MHCDSQLEAGTANEMQARMKATLGMKMRAELEGRWDEQDKAVTRLGGRDGPWSPRIISPSHPDAATARKTRIEKYETKPMSCAETSSSFGDFLDRHPGVQLKGSLAGSVHKCKEGAATRGKPAKSTTNLEIHWKQKKVQQIGDHFQGCSGAGAILKWILSSK